MSTSTSGSKISYIADLITHFRRPLFRNAYALILSAAITSGIGMLYWILAARSYASEVVGLNSAMISTMMFLGQMSHIGLVTALNRFIPTAGRATGRVISYSYLVGIVMALAFSLIFIQGVELWTPTLNILRSSTFFIVWFAFSTMGWAVFVLQDSALIGLRQAIWVPIVMTLYSLAKIGLLLGLAAIIPQYGVFASWILPLPVLLLLVNLLIFQRLIPRHVQEIEGHVDPNIRGLIARFSAGDYLGSMIWMATVALLPLMVLERVGASANAYFYLSFTVAYSLYLVSRGMGKSLVAEAAADQKKLAAYSYRILTQTARLVVPLVAIMVIGAPYILRLFGDSYATEGTAILRLFALAALPDIVISLNVSIARVQRRISSIILILSSLSVLVLALSYILLGAYGIKGIGVAWLISHTIVAMVLMLPQLRTVLFTYVDMQFLMHVLAVPRNLWWHLSHRRYFARASKIIPGILPVISPLANAPSPASWTAQRLIHTDNDVTMVALGSSGLPPSALLKLSKTDSGSMSLRRQKTTTAALNSDPRTNEWCGLIPTLLADGEIESQYYVVEEMLPGLDGRRVVSSPVAHARMLSAAANVIRDLHVRTKTSVMIDGEMLMRWIDEPLLLVRPVIAGRGHAARHERAIDRLSTELRDALAGRTISVSWIHGDFSPENILVTPDGKEVTGIVDWDLAAPGDIPQLDLLQLFLSMRRLVQRRELGDIINDLLDGTGWLPHEIALLNAAQLALPGDRIEVRALVLLTWLRHVAANLTKSTRFSGKWLWITKNVEGVLSNV